MDTNSPTSPDIVTPRIEVIESPRYILEGEVKENANGTSAITFKRESIAALAAEIDEHDEHDIRNKPLPMNYVSCRIQHKWQEHIIPLPLMAEMLNRTSWVQTWFRQDKDYAAKIRTSIQGIDTKPFTVETKKIDEVIAKKEDPEKQARIEAKKKEWELKESIWTRSDLEVMMKQWYGINLLGQNEAKKLHKIGEKAILNGNLGNPLELSDDLNKMKTGILDANRDKIVIVDKDSGKQEVKEPISPQIVDAMYAMVLESHITSQWFVIEIKDGQPVLHDTRKPIRATQMQWLQAILSDKSWQGEGEANIARYAAVSSFWKNPDDLSGHRNNLIRTIGWPNATSVTFDQIMKSNLSADEKTFIAAFRDTNHDDLLEHVIDEQKKWILNRIYTPEYKTKRQEIVENTDGFFKKNTGKGIMMAAWLAAFFGGLYLAFRKESSWWQRPIGVILAMTAWLAWAGSIDELTKKVWLTWWIRDRVEWNPVDKKVVPEIIDAPFATIDNWTGATDKYKRLVARLQWPTEWTKLLMDDKTWPAITGAPVGTMLYLLSTKFDTGWAYDDDKYKNFADTTKTAATEKMLASLTEDQRKTLVPLLEYTWESQRKNDAAYVSDIRKAQSMTLSWSIQSIDDRDGWYNTLPSWAWLPNGLRGNDKKTEALKIMAPNLEKLWKVKVHDINTFFTQMPTTTPPGEPWKTINTYFDVNQTALLREWWVNMHIDMAQISPDKKLNEIILSSYA